VVCSYCALPDVAAAAFFCWFAGPIIVLRLLPLFLSVRGFGSAALYDWRSCFAIFCPSCAYLALSLYGMRLLSFSGGFLLSLGYPPSLLITSMWAGVARACPFPFVLCGLLPSTWSACCVLLCILPDVAPPPGPPPAACQSYHPHLPRLSFSSPFLFPFYRARTSVRPALLPRPARPVTPRVRALRLSPARLAPFAAFCPCASVPRRLVHVPAIPALRVSLVPAPSPPTASQPPAPHRRPSPQPSPAHAFLLLVLLSWWRLGFTPPLSVFSPPAARTSAPLWLPGCRPLRLAGCFFHASLPCGHGLAFRAPSVHRLPLHYPARRSRPRTHPGCAVLSAPPPSSVSPRALLLLRCCLRLRVRPPVGFRRFACLSPVVCAPARCQLFRFGERPLPPGAVCRSHRQLFPCSRLVASLSLRSLGFRCPLGPSSPLPPLPGSGALACRPRACFLRRPPVRPHRPLRIFRPIPALFLPAGSLLVPVLTRSPYGRRFCRFRLRCLRFFHLFHRFHSARVPSGLVFPAFTGLLHLARFVAAAPLFPSRAFRLGCPWAACFPVTPASLAVAPLPTTASLWPLATSPRRSPPRAPPLPPFSPGALALCPCLATFPLKSLAPDRRPLPRIRSLVSSTAYLFLGPVTRERKERR